MGEMDSLVCIFLKPEILVPPRAFSQRLPAYSVPVTPLGLEVNDEARGPCPPWSAFPRRHDSCWSCMGPAFCFEIS